MTAAPETPSGKWRGTRISRSARSCCRRPCGRTSRRSTLRARGRRRRRQPSPFAPEKDRAPRSVRAGADRHRRAGGGRAQGAGAALEPRRDRRQCRHALDLLAAFTQDATKHRYRDWADLLGYCALSARPVGRQLLDLHGEPAALWAVSDPLCDALRCSTTSRTARPTTGTSTGSTCRSIVRRRRLGVDGAGPAARQPGAPPAAGRHAGRRLPAAGGRRGPAARAKEPAAARPNGRSSSGSRAAHARAAKAGPAGLAGRARAGGLRRLRSPGPRRAAVDPAPPAGGSAADAAMTTPPLTDDAPTALDAATGRAHVQAVVAASGTSFYWACACCRRAKRDAMYAIYAFCREVDDIADGALPAPVKLAQLAAWRAEVEALFAGRRELADDPGAGPAGAGRFDLRQGRVSDAMIDGMEMDAGERHAARRRWPSWSAIATASRARSAACRCGCSAPRTPARSRARWRSAEALAAHQHPARPDRGRRPRPALSAARAAGAAGDRRARPGARAGHPGSARGLRRPRRSGARQRFDEADRRFAGSDRRQCGRRW